VLDEIEGIGPERCSAGITGAVVELAQVLGGMLAALTRDRVPLALLGAGDVLDAGPGGRRCPCALALLGGHHRGRGRSARRASPGPWSLCSAGIERPALLDDGQRFEPVPGEGIGPELGSELSRRRGGRAARVRRWRLQGRTAGAVRVP
jgi:hypothetical protein